MEDATTTPTPQVESIESKKSHVWRVKTGEEIPMNEMSPDHLQKAFLHVTSKIFHYYKSSNKLDELLEELEEIATARGITLVYPDEAFPSKRWGAFFTHRRKVKSSKEEI